MKPCKWYQDWINNRVVLNRFRSAHVLFKKIINGTPGKVSSVSSADPSATTTHAGISGKLEKRLPKPGTVVTHNDKIEYDWKSPQLGAADAGEDGRKILEYIACAAQIPCFILGDTGDANLANLFVAENPFIRQIESYQTFFEAMFGELFRRVIQIGIDNGTLKENSTETTITEGYKWVGKARKFLKSMGLSEADTDADGNVKKTRTIPTRTDVAIEWPNLLHKNALEDAQVAQIHQAMGLASKETLRGKMGYDQDTEMERLSDEQDDDLDQYAAQRQAELDAAAAAGGVGDPSAPPKGAPKDNGKTGVPGGTDPARQGYGKA